jgi:hypothetical protein
VVPEPGLSPSVGQRVLEGGTSISWRLPGACLQYTRRLLRDAGAVGRGGGWGGLPGTLLGPEGSGDTDPVRAGPAPLVGGLGRFGGWVCRLVLLVVGPADHASVSRVGGGVPVVC